MFCLKIIQTILCQLNHKSVQISEFVYINEAHDLYTVDPRLSGPHLSGCSDYPDWVMTVLLECFVKSVCFIKVF